ncbi:MAG TPA: hypothetical protein P5572_04400 [Phycisphaerae bacterium]|mgnify:CR=1 FL=1|nr:hypothetical protein [Phycisphaerae bacterium]
MNKTLWIVPASVLALAALLPFAAAEDQSPATPAMETSPAETPSPSPTSSSLSPAERAFADLLTGVTLEGTWQSTNFAEGEAPALGEPHTDRYTIEKAEKLTGDHWMITARVQYADKDVALPVPVRVVWAGDTPVITLDTMSLPMLGTYSARVLFHKNFYSGVWYAADHGGVMSGRISRSAGDTKDN